MLPQSTESFSLNTLYSRISLNILIPPVAPTDFALSSLSAVAHRLGLLQTIFGVGPHPTDRQIL